MENITLHRASKESVIAFFQRELSLSQEDAIKIFVALNNIGCSSNHFNVVQEFPHTPNAMSFMIMVNKYNINVTKSVLSVLSFLLGLTPLGPALSIKDLISDTSNSVVLLNDNEKAMLEFLRGINDTGEFRISKIYDTFVSENDNEYTGINSKNDIDSILDSLADKGLVEIRTQTIKVLR